MEKISAFETWRKKYPVFYFSSYDFAWKNNKTLQLQFTYSIEEEWKFQPTMQIVFGKNIPLQEVPITSFVYHLGIIELISYWKATCSPTVNLPEPLPPEELPFWTTLFYHGLGEFFYKNGITVSQEEMMNIRIPAKKEISLIPYAFDENRVLVPIGGGKDSAVTLHLLLKHGYTVVPMIINPSNTTFNILAAAGINVEDAVLIHREIDPNLLSMNQRGFLNGHIPFSAVIAFYSVLVAALTGIRHIALSNESSANESTIPGTTINHQYSKTFAFEKLFRELVSRFLTPSANYFSFLRPLNELQIGALFSQMTFFHSVFRSCNVGSKKGIWCNHCPKCLFTHIILSPFLDPEYIRATIGLQALDNPHLENELYKLMGVSPEKPFECVGTTREVRSALALARQKFYQTSSPPVLLQKANAFLTPDDIHSFTDLITFVDEHHFLEEPFLQIIQHALEKI